jgi:ribosomal protein L11 methylase PrmA
LILAGVLQDDEAIIAGALAGSGLRVIEIKRDGEWIAFVARRAD